MCAHIGCGQRHGAGLGEGGPLTSARPLSTPGGDSCESRKSASLLLNKVLDIYCRIKPGKALRSHITRGSHDEPEHCRETDSKRGTQGPAGHL